MNTSFLFNPVLECDYIFPGFMEKLSRGHKANLRGKQSESAVADALEKIRQQPGLLRIPIESVIHANPNDNLDSQQIDFLVELKGGLDVKLQVKSAEGKRKKFIREMRRYGRFIVCVAVTAKDNATSIFYKVVYALREGINQIKHLDILEQAKRKLEDSKRHHRDRYNNQPQCRMCH